MSENCPAEERELASRRRRPVLLGVSPRSRCGNARRSRSQTREAIAGLCPRRPRRGRAAHGRDGTAEAVARGRRPGISAKPSRDRPARRWMLYPPPPRRHGARPRRTARRCRRSLPLRQREAMESQTRGGDRRPPRLRRRDRRGPARRPRSTARPCADESVDQLSEAAFSAGQLAERRLRDAAEPGADR